MLHASGTVQAVNLFPECAPSLEIHAPNLEDIPTHGSSMPLQIPDLKICPMHDDADVPGIPRSGDVPRSWNPDLLGTSRSWKFFPDLDVLISLGFQDLGNHFRILKSWHPWNSKILKSFPRSWNPAFQDHEIPNQPDHTGLVLNSKILNCLEWSWIPRSWNSKVIPDIYWPRATTEMIALPGRFNVISPRAHMDVGRHPNRRRRSQRKQPKMFPGARGRWQAPRKTPTSVGELFWSRRKWNKVETLSTVLWYLVSGEGGSQRQNDEVGQNVASEC